MVYSCFFPIPSDDRDNTTLDRERLKISQLEQEPAQSFDYEAPS